MQQLLSMRNTNTGLSLWDTPTKSPYLASTLVEGCQACQCRHLSDLSVGVQHVCGPLKGEDVGTGAGGQAHNHKHPQSLETVLGAIKGEEVEAAIGHAWTPERHCSHWT